MFRFLLEMFLVMTWLCLSTLAEHSPTSQEPADGGFLLICGEEIANPLAVWQLSLTPLLKSPVVAMGVDSSHVVVRVPFVVLPTKNYLAIAILN